MVLLGKLPEVNELPCGVIRDGEILRDYDLTEMTGFVRKAMASRKVRTDVGKVIDTLLEGCVTSIAGLEGKALKKGSFLRSLLIGDRDFLMLKIRHISIGNIVMVNMNCPSCQEKLDVNLDLDEIDIWGIEKDADEIDPNGRRIFTKVSEKLGITAKFRYPDGIDQTVIAQVARANPVEAQHRILNRCLVEWRDKDSQLAEPFPPNFFDGKAIRVVDWADKAFEENMPGPEMNFEVTCGVCGAESAANMESSDFLFPQTQNKKKSTSSDETGS